MHIEHRAQALFPDIPATRHAGAGQPRAKASTARLTCIVPAYNEAESLCLLLPELCATLDDIGLRWEIIVVDDGSHDATARVMHRWIARRGVTWLRLSRNFGKEAALSAGLAAAQGDIVVCLDADMQHPPALIAAMVQRWRQGVDMVYAQRIDRCDEAWTKRLGTRIFYGLLAKGHRVRIPEHAGDFRLMDRQVVDALVAMPERSRFMKGLYAWVGFEAEAMPYVPAPRARGNSRFSLFKLAALALDGLTAFTTWPLRMISIAGMILAFLAFGYGVELTIEYASFGNRVSGWTTLITALLFFAGVNMFSLGIVGEYVGRIFDEVKGRPLYVVRSRMGTGLDATPPAKVPGHGSGSRVGLH